MNTRTIRRAKKAAAAALAATCLTAATATGAGAWAWSGPPTIQEQADACWRRAAPRADTFANAEAAMWSDRRCSNRAYLFAVTQAAILTVRATGEGPRLHIGEPTLAAQEAWAWQNLGWGDYYVSVYQLSRAFTDKHVRGPVRLLVEA